MTLPEQSNRAVKHTREFLVRLSSPFVEGGIKGIRREVRAEALALLRHYPLSWDGDCPEQDNAASQDNTPATHATPSEGSVQDGCTLTDEVERLGGCTPQLDCGADRKSVASQRCRDTGGQPFDSAPITLTAKEREAVEVACQDLRHTEEVATLRGLLERTR